VQNGLSIAAYIAALAVESPLLPSIVNLDWSASIFRHLMARLLVGFVNSRSGVREHSPSIGQGRHGEE